MMMMMMMMMTMTMMKDGQVYNDITESQRTCQEHVSNLTPTVGQVLHTMHKSIDFSWMYWIPMLRRMICQQRLNGNACQY